MFGKLLIIEDDLDLANIIGVNMQDLGFETKSVHNGNEGLIEAQKDEYRFIILDLNLPGLSGFDICQKLRMEGNKTPILILTSSSEVIDTVTCLETGADDYLSKPFNIRELQARVRAILRRYDAIEEVDTTKTNRESVITCSGLELDPNKAEILRNGELISLTAKEFQLLLHFAKNPGHVFNRNQLLEAVWGYGYDGYEHTVNSTINRLRSKIEKDPARPEIIVTVRGLGYRFNKTD